MPKTHAHGIRAHTRDANAHNNSHSQKAAPRLCIYTLRASRTVSASGKESTRGSISVPREKTQSASRAFDERVRDSLFSRNCVLNTSGVDF